MPLLFVGHSFSLIFSNVCWSSSFILLLAFNRSVFLRYKYYSYITNPGWTIMERLQPAEIWLFNVYTWLANYCKFESNIFLNWIMESSLFSTDILQWYEGALFYRFLRDSIEKSWNSFFACLRDFFLNFWQWLWTFFHSLYKYCTVPSSISVNVAQRGSWTVVGSFSCRIPDYYQISCNLWTILLNTGSPWASANPHCSLYIENM